jgi:hypothetical protein
MIMMLMPGTTFVFTAFHDFEDWVVKDSESNGSSIGRPFILSRYFLSIATTHHRRQRKKRKNITNDTTGQMAI